MQKIVWDITWDNLGAKDLFAGVRDLHDQPPAEVWLVGRIAPTDKVTD